MKRCDKEEVKWNFEKEWEDKWQLGLKTCRVVSRAPGFFFFFTQFYSTNNYLQVH